jgi:putative ABC transport system permease protein
MLFALGGIAAGLIAAFLLTRVLANLLYGIPATDLTTFGGTTLLLIVVALLACCLPARRATSVNPVEVLQRD